ncbi:MULTISPECIES: DUF6514 family protein [unclassified Clostridium]|jgi:hypothetical protein|uniref:DUF6514 family protein n=1 Tax=Clostridium TaxID=1485 RepID=UPI001C8BDB92|nr:MULTISPECIES: DUF6514 family protein [unclassified Clostridium]MBX9138993.1 hypothetical protein [Clostridium sp. K12(2020)]MBX9145455.1 hypothetical protein [Clostridium sp. K13]MDU2290475.1 DUF6514 family protein [Clostridium celatum]MDU4323907.1 DUF6514 family protein [Clostridium celatum]
MKINKTLSTIVNINEKEVKYIYRMTEKNIRNRQAFGIEIERQDFNDGQVVNLERDYVSLVASEEKRANDILLLLFNNLVSPIHLVDIVGEYSDLCAAEF